ncbi:anthranilate synthase component 1 [Candidatus Woesearchaeota archaeon]|nr:anthranilate synthase component 1 [Candidatus Woesearchaeota archaeon]
MTISKYKNIIKKSKTGSIIPVYKTINKAVDPVELFANLSDYGKKQNSILLESADIVPKYGRYSFGTADPCIKLFGKNNKFSIIALNDLGKKIIDFINDDFGFCDELKIKKEKITGTLIPKKSGLSEKQRIKKTTHMDIIRKLAFRFTPVLKPFNCYGGLFGAISYDFIDQYEKLSQDQKDPLDENDYEFYFVDNLFFIDHKKQKTHLIANAIKLDSKTDRLLDNCEKKINHYEKILNKDFIKPKTKNINNKIKIRSDISKKEFIKNVDKIKDHINQGDIFQCVYSQTFSTKYFFPELDIYSQLKKLNPSPYMFYMNLGNTTLLGASPEMNLRVQEKNNKKIVEIRPIAGTKPRGIINNKIDPDLDSRYEIEIKTDKKEIAEHTMLVDLARNDIAKISKSGTRVVDETFVVEKYSHVQHLVSNVCGELKEDLDCLHAYTAAMNMGTLTGAPKIRAMEFLREYEKTKRGYYGGAVCYITPDKEFDSCIIIRSMTLKNNSAYVRAGAGIVYDSIPEKEYEETQKKARACLEAIESAGDK